MKTPLNEALITWQICLIAVFLLFYGCQANRTEPDPEPAIEAIEGFVPVAEGVELRYKILGNGPQTVIIPAAIYMEYVFEQLADPGFTLIFYDPRSRGKSTTVTDRLQIGMEFEVADLEALRRNLNKEKISLIGWSYLGGMVALYALRYPEHVDRVIQIGPIPPTQEFFLQATASPIDEESLSQIRKMQEDGLEKSDPEAYCRQYWDIYMRRIFFDPSKIAGYRSDKCLCPNEMPDHVNLQLGTILGKLGQWNWLEEMRRLPCPVLTIHGDADTLPLEGSRTWAAVVPDARLLVIPEAGHLPFVEQPELFFPAVKKFLKGSWPEGAEKIENPALDTK